jgi:hypothetical protein
MEQRIKRPPVASTDRQDEGWRSGGNAAGEGTLPMVEDLARRVLSRLVESGARWQESQ